jgi:broad specificity phosphatase PhoE
MKVQISLLKNKYRKVKVVHWIRHAQGYHNIGGEAEAKARHNIDARLTPQGIDQCLELAEKIRTAKPCTALSDVRDKAQLIVTSPVTRCVQTAVFSLEPVIERNRDIQIVANENIRETVNFNCDRRRPIHEIAEDFPQVDFNVACPNDEDAIWEYYETMLGDDNEYTLEREQAEVHVIAGRARHFFTWLGDERDEDNVIVCSHATVSRAIFNFGHPGKTACDVPQALDTRGPDAKDVPVVNYGTTIVGNDASYIRENFKNCELRSMIVAYN